MIVDLRRRFFSISSLLFIFAANPSQAVSADSNSSFISNLNIFADPGAKQIFWHQSQLSIPYDHPEFERIVQLQREAKEGAPVDLAQATGFVWVRHPEIIQFPNSEQYQRRPSGVTWLIDPRGDWPLWSSRFKHQNLGLQIAFEDPSPTTHWITIPEDDIEDIKDLGAHQALMALYRKKYFEPNIAIGLIRERGLNHEFSNLSSALRIMRPGPYIKTHQAWIASRILNLQNKVLVYAQGQPSSIFVFNPDDQVSDSQNLMGEIYLITTKGETAATLERFTYDLFFLRHEERPHILRISAQVRGMLLRKKPRLTYGELASLSEILGAFSRMNFEAWGHDLKGIWTDRIAIPGAEPISQLEIEDLIKARDLESQPACRAKFLDLAERAEAALRALK